MTIEHSSNSNSHSPHASSRPAGLRGMIAVTILATAVIGVLFSTFNFWNERFNMNPGLPNVMLIAVTIIGWLSWSLWLMFVPKFRWIGGLILVGPALGLLLYHPEFGGDANIVGWQPRFTSGNTNLPIVAESGDSAESSSLEQTSFDFPQFLGADRNGIVANVALQPNWETNPPKLRWKQTIGEGWSGFAIVNRLAFTQEQREDRECVTCYDIETGNLVWMHSAARRHEDMLGLGKVGPRATPTIYNGKIYALGATGVLECLDGSSGKLIWSVDIPQQVGISQKTRKNSRGLEFTEEDSNLVWGRSSSPLIHNNNVIVPGGISINGNQQRAATLIAYELNSGNEVWRGGQRMIGYGSPSIATLHGQSQILLMGEDHVVGHDPQTGAELWCHYRPGNSSRDAHCSQVTALGNNQLLLSKGYNLGGEIIEIQRDQAGQYAVQSIAADRRVLKTKLTNPIVLEGHAYSLSDGFLECVQIPSLQRKWKKRGRFGNGQLLLVGSHLLVHSENGQLILVAADPNQYAELGSIKTINGTCWNTIGFYRNLVLVRSEREAACFELAVSFDKIATLPKVPDALHRASSQLIPQENR